MLQAYCQCRLSVCPMCARVRRVAEGLLQQLFPRDAQQPPAAGEGGNQRFKGMVKVTKPPECTALVSCQEFHLPLIECALALVHHTISISTTPQQARCCSGWAAAGLLAVSILAPRRQMQATMHSTKPAPTHIPAAPCTRTNTPCASLCPAARGPRLPVRVTAAAKRRPRCIAVAGSKVGWPPQPHVWQSALDGMLLIADCAAALQELP